jgi:hypothetical protein
MLDIFKNYIKSRAKATIGLLATAHKPVLTQKKSTTGRQQQKRCLHAAGKELKKHCR